MPATSTLVTLRHRTASSDPTTGCWEYDVRHGIHKPMPLLIVRVRLMLGSVAYDAEIPVCTSRYPTRHAWPIRQVAESTWRVSCARYAWDTSEMAMPHPYAPGMPVLGLELVMAPPEVEADLLKIDEVLKPSKSRIVVELPE